MQLKASSSSRNPTLSLSSFISFVLSDVYIENQYYVTSIRVASFPVKTFCHVVCCRPHKRAASIHEWDLRKGVGLVELHSRAERRH